MNTARVVIIGAGIAGLNCAFQLKKAGLHAVVCEASDRVGGRIWTDQDENGTPFERGGEFINEDHRDLRALCRELGVPLHCIYCEGQVAPVIGYMDGDTLRSDVEFAAAVQPLVRRLREDWALMRDGNSAPRRERFDRSTAAAYLEQTALPEWADRHVRLFLVAEMGRELTELPATTVFSLAQIEPDRPWIVPPGYARYVVDGGTGEVTRALADRLEGQIETDRTLTAIRKVGGHYHLSFDGRSEDLVADWVVLAVPFTALRRVDLDRAAFSPRRRRAIQELQYATNAKIIVPYRGRVAKARQRVSEVFSDSLRAFVWESSCYRPGDYSSLTVYRGGTDGARTSPTTIPVEKETLIARLDAAYPGSACQQQGECIAVHWPDGSYSCPGPGQATDLGDVLGGAEGRALFCGEHASTAARGFMSGAAASGVEAARRLLTAVVLSTTNLTRPDRAIDSA
jgi:monoamine oxidase